MQKIIDLYEASVLRAKNTPQGLSFQTDDRKALVAELESLAGFNYKDVGHAIARREHDGGDGYNTIYARHTGRLEYFLRQFGTLRKAVDKAPVAPVELVAQEEETQVSAPINATVQGLVDALIETSVKHGVTSTHALLPYINRSIEKRKATQRIETATDRVLDELRGTGLSREQMLLALRSVSAAI